MRDLALLGPLVLSLSLVGCGSGDQTTEAGGLTGTVAVDGSSTVFPITEAAAEEFGKVQPRVRVTVGTSGTGGGFKKFCVGETQINDASRPIKEKELVAAKEKGIGLIELPIAFDGLSVLINPKNDFVDHLTVGELKRIWEPGSKVMNWGDVRKGWPKRKINLYGPGTDSGTFDYFTEAIVGEAQRSRSDFTASEDDNVLVQGIAGDPDALGYFGYAYYAENRGILKLVPIMAEGATAAVQPSETTINDGTYTPLSRPIFIYVASNAADLPEVKAFVEFYLDNVPNLSAEVGYVPFSTEVYDLVKAHFRGKVTGSAFLGKDTTGVDLVKLLSPQG